MTDPSTRIERDTFGPIEVPADRLWGAQTQRSLEHFRISTEKMPEPLIRALADRQARRRRASTRRWARCRSQTADAIVAAADEVLAGRHRRRISARRLADRIGHADQHERQRGARQPRVRAPRRAARRGPARASERRRQPRAVVERRLPDGDERRRGRGGDAQPAAGADRAARRRWRRRPRPSPTSSRSAARTCRTRRR